MTSCHRHKILDGGGSTHFGQAYYNACQQRQSPILAQVISPSLEMSNCLHLDADKIKKEDDWIPVMKAIKVNRDLKEIRLFSNASITDPNGYEDDDYANDDDDDDDGPNGSSAVTTKPVRLSRPKFKPASTSSVASSSRINGHIYSSTMSLSAKDKVKKAPALLRLSRVSIYLISAIRNCLQRSNAITCLELAGFNLSPKALDLLGKGLAGNTSIKELSLARSHIGDDGLYAITSGIKAAKSLTYVNLSACRLTSRGAFILSELLKSQAVQRQAARWVHTLRAHPADPLREGYVTIDKPIPISPHPSRLNSRVQSHQSITHINSLSNVYINHNSDLMASAVPTSSAVTSTTPTPIRRLNLCCNDFGDEGIETLFDGLNEEMGLMALDLQFCDVSDAGARIIQQVLGLNRELVVVDLRNNVVDPILMRVITTALQMNVNRRLKQAQETIPTATSSNTILNQSILDRDLDWLPDGNPLQMSYYDYVNSNALYGGGLGGSRISLDNGISRRTASSLARPVFPKHNLAAVGRRVGGSGVGLNVKVKVGDLAKAREPLTSAGRSGAGGARKVGSGGAGAVNGRGNNGNMKTDAKNGGSNKSTTWVPPWKKAGVKKKKKASPTKRSGTKSQEPISNPPVAVLPRVAWTDDSMPITETHPVNPYILPDSPPNNLPMQANSADTSFNPGNNASNPPVIPPRPIPYVSAASPARSGNSLLRPYSSAPNVVIVHEELDIVDNDNVNKGEDIRHGNGGMKEDLVKRYGHPERSTLEEQLLVENALLKKRLQEAERVLMGGGIADVNKVGGRGMVGMETDANGWYDQAPPVSIEMKDFSNGNRNLDNGEGFEYGQGGSRRVSRADAPTNVKNDSRRDSHAEYGASQGNSQSIRNSVKVEKAVNVNEVVGDGYHDFSAGEEEGLCAAIQSVLEIRGKKPRPSDPLESRPQLSLDPSRTDNGNQDPSATTIVPPLVNQESIFQLLETSLSHFSSVLDTLEREKQERRRVREERRKMKQKMAAEMKGKVTEGRDLLDRGYVGWPQVGAGYVNAVTESSNHTYGRDGMAGEDHGGNDGFEVERRGRTRNILQDW
ncbi:Centrosomal protein of 78 kDa [Blyttiomyces sp. JEL0837]|nr:Centrosomal protein of 78 kDa [Blyttiomyces sp. JEL0837]